MAPARRRRRANSSVSSNCRLRAEGHLSDLNNADHREGRGWGAQHARPSSHWSGGTRYNSSTQQKNDRGIRRPQRLGRWFEKNDFRQKAVVLLTAHDTGQQKLQPKRRDSTISPPPQLPRKVWRDSAQILKAIRLRPGPAWARGFTCDERERAAERKQQMCFPRRPRRLVKSHDLTCSGCFVTGRRLGGGLARRVPPGSR